MFYLDVTKATVVHQGSLLVALDPRGRVGVDGFSGGEAGHLLLKEVTEAGRLLRFHKRLFTRASVWRLGGRLL